MTQKTGERVNQKARTRQALIDACRALMEVPREGYPSIEEVAEEALVSRATAYRYYPNIVDLISDVYFDRATRGDEALFGHTDDPESLAERVDRAERSINDFLFGDLLATHIAVKQGADRWLEAEGKAAPRDVRPGRRMPLIDQAMAPCRDQLDATAFDRLRAALAMTIGTEAAVALCDIAGLDPAEAEEVASWATRALVDAALRSADD